jgi:hypothetical protein
MLGNDDRATHDHAFSAYRDHRVRHHAPRLGAARLCRVVSLSALMEKQLACRVNVLVLLLFAALARAAAAQEAPPPDEPDARAFFHEPALLTAGIDLVQQFDKSGDGDPDDGFYPKVGGMITGAGWIAGGPGYRHHFFGGMARGDAHATVSWRGFLLMRARLEFPELADGRFLAGVQALWQDSTQLNYFGIGPDTPDFRTQYRLQSTDLVGYARYKPERWLALSSRVGWLHPPSVDAPTGPFRPDAPASQTVFPDDPAMTLAEQPHYFHGEAAITFDTRNYTGHPTHGGLYRASAGAFVASQSQFSFSRYEVEGLQTFPMFDRAWVIVARGWGVFTQTSGNREVPFYLMPTLGGANTLPGFDNYRFRDRNSLLAGVESRWAIWAHMDGALFFDAGTVAPVIRDLGLDTTAYGFGFRIHTHNATVARLDFAFNREGFSVLWRSSDPYNLNRLKRWAAQIPFVP